MPYCTLADLEAAYGVEVILRTQPKTNPPVDPPVINEAAIEAAIEAATAEVDSYVMCRYRLPLADELAAVVKRPCVDIAMYHLAPIVSSADEVRHKRYNDAVKWLKRVADGKAVLRPRPAAVIRSEPRREYGAAPHDDVPSPFYRRGGYSPRKGRFA